MPNLRGKTWTTTTPANVEDAQYWEDHLISDTAAAKAASSVQTVNNTPPDASGNVDVVALPSGGTLGQVLTKQSSVDGDADWEDPASSGHTIEDEDGNTMPYQSTLQFTNAEVTNDTVNSKTVVDCKGAKGDAATVTAGTTTTLPAGSSATVVNSGTTSAAVFNFGIPQGADGADGTDGVSVTGVTLLSTSGKVKTYRMSFSDGSHFDYNVTDGSDGTGAGDMLQSDYDPLSTVLNAGGIADYVQSQAYMLPTAASNILGGVKVGTNLSIDGNGVLSATDTTYSDATTSASGLMSATDKSKLNGIASGAEVNVQSDWNQADSTADDYIKNKPTIPAAQIQSNWGQTDNTKLDYILNKPTIPAAANNGQLTIQKNGSTVQTFSADQVSNVTANIITDDWVKVASVSSGSVTFSGIDDSGNYGYEVFFNITSSSTNKNPSAQLSAISGEGTSNMSLTYTTDADNGTNNAKLRRIK
jgi:hypothetical protein